MSKSFATRFRTIINYLRGDEATAVPLPSSAQESDALVREADFYGVRFFPYPLVFAAGGHNGYEHLSQMEVLDVGNQCWRPCKSMRTERTYFAVRPMSGLSCLKSQFQMKFYVQCLKSVFQMQRSLSQYYSFK